MPRFRLSAKSETFGVIIEMLQKNDDASKSAWDLLQMLATNEEIYKQVMNVEEADWEKFFDSSNVYSLMYKL